jgi:kynurenine aminotransferase
LIGEPHLIKYAAAAHTRIVFCCVSPLQEAVAIGFEKAEAHGYYEDTVKAYQDRMKTLNKVWDELGLPVPVYLGGLLMVVYRSSGWVFCYGKYCKG